MLNITDTGNVNDAEISTLPLWETRNFCRWLIKAVEESFKDPEFKKRFEEWERSEEGKENGEEYITGEAGMYFDGV